MASIEARRNKDGKIISYKLVVFCGCTPEGKKIRHSSTWTPPHANMTERQMYKEATAAAYKLEERFAQGYVIDNHQTFAEYAKYAIHQKEEAGVRPATIDRYWGLMERINEKIGGMEITKIRPQHLNEFYSYLKNEAHRKDTVRAVATRALKNAMREWGISNAAVAREANLSASTLTKALKGDPITVKSAKAIAEVLDINYDELFKEHDDPTPLSSKTVLEHHRLISSIFAMAVKEMIIPYNPAERATPPRSKPPVPDYYQPDEMDDILDALDNAPLKWKTITYLMIDTGCRRGEIMGLKWKNVNMDTGLIVIESALLYTKSKGTYEGETKTGKTRAMILAPQSMALLREWRKKQLELKLANGPHWIDTDFVFTRDDGSCMHPDSITCWLTKFSAENNLPHIHPHAFRHTAASTMIANGVDLVTAATELGHANATTTANIYAHQIAVARAKAANVRGGVFSTRRNRNPLRKKA